VLGVNRKLKPFFWIEPAGILIFLLALTYGLSPVPGAIPPDNTWQPASVSMAMSLKSLHFKVDDTPDSDLMAVGSRSRDAVTIKFSDRQAAMARDLGFSTDPQEISRTQYLILLNDIHAKLDANQP
jgi:hypothetical protein